MGPPLPRRTSPRCSRSASTVSSSPSLSLWTGTRSATGRSRSTIRMLPPRLTYSRWCANPFFASATCTTFMRLPYPKLGGGGCTATVVAAAPTDVAVFGMGSYADAARPRHAPCVSRSYRPWESIRIRRGRHPHVGVARTPRGRKLVRLASPSARLPRGTRAGWTKRRPSGLCFIDPRPSSVWQAGAQRYGGARRSGAGRAIGLVNLRRMARARRPRAAPRAGRRPSSPEPST